jgi:transcriptional regulator with XRE-family HTH domain
MVGRTQLQGIPIEKVKHGGRQPYHLSITCDRHFTGFLPQRRSRILHHVAELRKQVGARLRELRLARGLTQEQLGERAGLSYKFIGEVERGIGNPTLDSLANLAAALEVQVVELVTQGDTPSRTKRLSATDYQMVREARDSLEALLKGARPGGRSGRR